MNIDKMLKELKVYAGCAVCKHCDKAKYPAYSYCEYGGCNGGGTGKVKEDRWEYHN